ncbi:MAG: PqqD family protein [Bacteroidota bacterium]
MTRYKRNDENFLISQLGQELVLMDTKTGDYLGINAVGTHIWNLLAGSKSVQELVTDLISRFEVTESQCQTEVENFLSDLEKRKMVSLA